jgi:hypothetical protein
VLVDRVLDDALHLARHQLALGLRVEAGVRVLDVDDAEHALARVVPGQAVLGVLEQIVLLTVVVQRAGQRPRSPVRWVPPSLLWTLFV